MGWARLACLASSAAADESGGFLDANGPTDVAFSEAGEIGVVAADFPDQLQSMPDLSFVFPGGQSACPPAGPGLPPAGPLPAQSVPTRLSCPSDGNDAGCLVGELTGLPFAPGSARIDDISTNPSECPVAAGGFTTIVDLAHSAAGDLFVLEYARQGLPGIFGIAPPLGGLSRVSGAITQSLDGGRLTAPSGIAVCGDFVYVTDRTRTAGAGRLLRMRLD